MSFPCTHCLSDKTGVIDSRYSENQGIRRRRECEVCGARFTTREVLAEEIAEDRMTISLSGLPVDQQRAVRTLVEALSYVDDEAPAITYAGAPRREVEDA